MSASEGWEEPENATGSSQLHQRISPLAYLVLQQHRAKSDRAMYDIAALGTRQPSPSQLEQLALAYQELEREGLVVRTEEVQRFRDRFFYLYRPAQLVSSGSGN